MEHETMYAAVAVFAMATFTHHCQGGDVIPSQIVKAGLNITSSWSA